MSRIVLAIVATLVPQLAHAEEYEAEMRATVVAGAARVAEDVDTPAEVVPAAGLAGMLGYGLRDSLTIEGELAITALTTARYPDALVRFDGGENRGPTERITRTARLSGGATLRLGVAWIPTVHAGLGIQARWRTAAVFLPRADQVPNGMDTDVSLDLTATIRVGLDRRINRRWMVGASVGVTHAVPLGAPAFDLFDVHLSASYVWYPLW